MHPAARSFIEQMGLSAERDGMPRIAGRLLGFLLIDGGIHSLDDLAEVLQVSKASVSTNTRALENLQLIQRRTIPGDRRDFFQIGENPGEQMFELARQRLDESRRNFEAARKDLPEEMNEARERLAAWSSFYAFLLDDIDIRLERWRQQQSS